MSRSEFYYDSSDGITTIHAIKWIPDNEIKAVLQISHGMLEHMERYDDFAAYMAEQGILTVGNDHLGHGSSIISEEKRGYFHEYDGNRALLDDMHTLLDIVKDEYEDVPYFILGHSMGSFLTRQFVTEYGNEFDGAIISGTGQQSLGLIKFGIFVTKLIASFKGWNYRSKFVDFLAVGMNNNKFKPARTKFDWLTRDDDIVDNYIADSRIQFIFTLNGFYNLFSGILKMNEQERLERIPKEFPMIFLSGDMDSVGNFGKDVEKTFNLYKNLGMKNISMKLYKGDRHEILNELDREQIYEDILLWISELIIEDELI
ncbi:MAG: alpha/beta fold hydrolase [Sedimentibacter sp.]